MKTLTIARREFLSTVMTTGFVIGVLIFPLIMVAVIAVVPKLLSDKPPQVEGEVMVLDRSGWEGSPDAPIIRESLEAMYSPEQLAMETEAFRQAVRRQQSEQFGEAGEAAADSIVEQMIGDVPEITITPLADDAALEAARPRLFEGRKGEIGLLAIVVIDENAVRKIEATVPGADPGAGETPAESGFGSYTLLLRPNLDDRIENPLHEKVQQAIRTARFAAAGQDLALANELNSVRRGGATVVTAGGEKASTGGAANIFLAIGFMFLIYASVMTGGQYLMMTVIEEKSSRVMEVLLSAASPTQLMTGKIIGQMCVAMVVVSIYLGIGLIGLSQFNMLYLISVEQIGLVAIYFFLAFFMMATLMAAVGSAVTEIREAQSYMTAVMILMILPWMLFMPLVRNPNSTFATIAGLVPPISPFAMAIRLAASEPIPVWQVVASIVIGIITVLALIWVTAKIFRVGVLMYGKPPNFATLIRWVRMA